MSDRKRQRKREGEISQESEIVMCEQKDRRERKSSKLFGPAERQRCDSSRGPPATELTKTHEVLYHFQTIIQDSLQIFLLFRCFALVSFRLYLVFIHAFMIRYNILYCRKCVLVSVLQLHKRFKKNRTYYIKHDRRY